MRDLSAALASFLGALGMEYVPPKERVAKGGWKSWFRPMSMDDHYVDYHGTLHRRDRKRDKSISARQWKMKMKAQRRAAKAA